jgi:FixJ family two-component response regulator
MSKLIFIVDDEKRIAETLEVILRKVCYDVGAFCDAQSSLKQREIGCPELVINDFVQE